MSWVNEPSDLAQLPQLEQSDVFEDEPADPLDKFWEEASMSVYGGVSTGYRQGAHVRVCRFDEYGNHTSMSDDCPHYDSSDEEGPRVRPGWTVQDNKARI